MQRFASRIALGLVLVAALSTHAIGQVTIITPDLASRVNREIFSVTLNGINVSDRSTFYLGADGTVYAGAGDLIAWHLKYPSEPSFTRDEVQYYGLQTLLRLAVSVRRPEERLEILAPSTAFIGGPERAHGPFAPGGGAFMNYKLDRTVGDYDAFFTHNASGLEVDYQSMQSSNSIAFARELTHFYTMDVNNHRIFDIGEQQVDAPEVGESAKYLGLHIASEFGEDPLFVSHALPSVTGVASTPSVVEVYINNVLQWREEVPAGPFVVRDLPPSASFSDIVLVITDRSGHRTTEVVRPNVQRDLLRPGLTSYSLDAGLGQDTFSSASPRYSAPIASTTIRHGVTPWLTIQAMGQSMDGENFGAGGFQMRPGFGQQLTAWYGAGNLRQTGLINYQLSTNTFGFTERIRFNSETQADEFNPGGAFSKYSETSTLRLSMIPDVSIDLNLNRSVSNASAPQAVYSMDTSYTHNWYTITLRPSYDRYAHAVSATVELQQRIGGTHDLQETVDRPAGQSAQTTLAYQKQQRDQNDPLAWGARIATGNSDMSELSFADRMPWAEAKVIAQDQDGIGNVQTQLNGSLQLVGGNLSATRVQYTEEVVGLVRLPGFPGVRISVNGSPAASTDRRGNAVLTRLAALEENVISADLSEIPLAVGVKDPVRVEPLPATPVTIDLLETKAQSFDVSVIGPDGKPLAPASHIVADNNTQFPVGYEGRAFLRGLGPGEHPCSFRLTFAPRWEIIERKNVICS
ncbi:MAG TPA: fimbria/pilus outer membrane usher protein [Candidatus Acidoferrales bacterium]|nr:fimbria/pilus outer membrane usher protein [Candidatus Acidoferrales bacterium]